jgi:hypothetical protein
MRTFFVAIIIAITGVVSVPAANAYIPRDPTFVHVTVCKDFHTFAHGHRKHRHCHVVLEQMPPPCVPRPGYFCPF